MWDGEDAAEWWSGSDSEDEIPEASLTVDPEVWQDYTSEFTVAAYHELQDMFQRMGAPVLDQCTYHAFAHFCYNNSSGHIPDVDAPFPRAPFRVPRPRPSRR